MRIVVVVSEFPKVTETFAISNIRHYLAHGHDVSVFHVKPFRTQEVVHDEARPVVDRAFSYPWLFGTPLGALARCLVTRPLALGGVVTQFVRAFWKEPVRLAASFALLPKAVALAQFCKDESVDHVHAEFASHPATTAWVAHRLSGVDFSFSAHMHDIFVSTNLLAEKSQEASFVRTISDYNMRLMADLPGFDAGKLNLVRCGVDLTKFAFVSRDPSTVEERFEILYVGSLFPRKGCPLLLEALARIGTDWNWHLTLIGQGPLNDEIEKTISQMPAGRVSKLGARPSDEVQKAMAAAHLFVLPSYEVPGGRSEGIPVVLMEAMASGCPVISSRISGIPELIEDGVCGTLIEPQDVDGLARAIVSVREDYPRALDMSQAARRKVENEYNIKENAQDLMELLENA